MYKDEQRRKAEEFLALHQGPHIFVLPNAWDVASARIFQLEGFKAIGTTSAGISATLGYPDGQHMSAQQNVEVVSRIAAAVNLPVSADMEAGYADCPDGVANSARLALRAGAVGLNLEDGTGNPAAPLLDVSLQAERIQAIREMASSEGIPLVINARTDVYLVSDTATPDRLDQTVKRANAYQQAGADCIFVPDFGDLDRDTIARLVDEIDAPLNVIPSAGTPPLAELEAIGVARVSVGPKPMRAALALVRRVARELRDAGTYTQMTADTLSYSEINRMFVRDALGYCTPPAP